MMSTRLGGIYCVLYRGPCMRIPRRLGLLCLVVASWHRSAAPAQLYDESQVLPLCQIMRGTIHGRNQEIIVSGLLRATFDFVRLQDAECPRGSLYILGSLAHHGAGWEQWHDLIVGSMDKSVPDKTPVTITGKINSLATEKGIVWQISLDRVVAINGVAPSR
jgi:hypothetical protein